jgi:hypothetical protein
MRKKKYWRYRDSNSDVSSLCTDCAIPGFLWVSSKWSSGQSSYLQIQRSGFDSRRYQIFWEVVGLERGPFGLVSTTEELLERKSSWSCLESQQYCCSDPSRWPHGTIYPQKLTLASLTSCGRSVLIVLSQTQATELKLVLMNKQIPKKWEKLSSITGKFIWRRGSR